MELYLKRYPDGGHKSDANELLASLKASDVVARGSPRSSCERLATHPGDATANAPGVDLATLAVNASEAIEACRQAASAHPEIPHYVALEARAEFAAQHYDQAIELYRKAADAGDGRALYSLGYLQEIGRSHAQRNQERLRALRKSGRARQRRRRDQPGGRSRQGQGNR